MPRTLTIVAAGEALLDETGPTPALAGLALSCSAYALRLGHVGVAVSRVGQDATAHTMLEEARALGIDVEHVQSDPDLPTGRRWIRRLAGRSTVQIDTRAAFDNLQWDHDLISLAMRAHVIITGSLVRRNGQARAEIDRFVSEGRTALKVFDLVNRDDERFDRREQLAMLNLVDVAVIDRRAGDVVMPSQRGVPLPDVARLMLREFKLHVVVALDEGTLHIVTPGESASQSLQDSAAPIHELLVVCAAHFIAHGCEPAACSRRSAAVVHHAATNAPSAIPAALLDVQ